MIRWSHFFKFIEEPSGEDVIRIYDGVNIGKCREWTGYIAKDGYGYYSVPRVGGGAAHRLVWKNAFGDPNGLFVLHHCDNRKCVNVDHLWLGTTQDNMDDMRIKGRAAVGERNGSKTHPECVLRGEKHPFAKNPEKHARGHGIGGSPLFEYDVRRIRELYASGISQCKLAIQFGIAQQNISSIVRRKNWKHV